MATVYLARLSGAGGFQRFVAIKRLHPHLAGDTDFIEMFLDEARLAARLHHPNVVPIVEIGESDEGYYLVMEYIEGDTLARLLARSGQSGQPLPTGAGVRIILDTLAGLEAAHELCGDDGSPLNIVHRDVSPQNILIGLDGSARITDFGVARAATRLSTTRTGQLKGKLAYMAPEQARGSDVDRRADVFALGIVLWETLAQRRLFKGDAEAETLNRVLYEPIPLVRSASPNVPAALEAVCAKALERDPSARFQSCSEMADALEREARVAGLLGSHKDVAAHLSTVMGTDISQQRDAMRAWLARSEPSRPRELRQVSGPISGVKQLDSGPPRMMSPTPVTSRSGLKSGISSVSAAALEVSPEFAESSSAAPRRSRTAVWIGLAVAVVVVVCGASFYGYTRSGSTPAAAPPSASASAVAPTNAPAAVIDSGPAPAATLAPPSASASAAPTAKSPTGHAGSLHAAPKPSATQKVAPVGDPDDMSNNPYRQ